MLLDKTSRSPRSPCSNNDAGARVRPNGCKRILKNGTGTDEKQEQKRASPVFAPREIRLLTVQSPFDIRSSSVRFKKMPVQRNGNGKFFLRILYMLMCM